ncbi:hypothetical protein F4810DRAFT_268518 [Camillea tinctor]|nr:hypothetical protein F4810DRAFT_268518 [Camillea tinctor]
MASGRGSRSRLHRLDTAVRGDFSDNETGGTPLPLSGLKHGESDAEDIEDGDATTSNDERTGVYVSDSAVADEEVERSSDDSALAYPDTDSNRSLSHEGSSDDVDADGQDAAGLDSDVEERMHQQSPSSISTSTPTTTTNQTRKSSSSRNTGQSSARSIHQSSSRSTRQSSSSSSRQSSARSTPKARVKSSVISPARLFPVVNSVFDWVWGRNTVLTREDRPDSRALKDEGQGWRGQPFIDEEFLDIPDVQDICPACTTPYCQAIESTPFKSCLRLSYNDPETHRWFLGDRYVMTETADTHPEQKDVPVIEVTGVIRRMTPVPVPNVVAGWKEHGKVITIAERVPGERLYDIWWHLSRSQRERIAKQVAGYVEQWRRCRSDRISSLNGGPVWDHNSLFGTAVGEGFGPFRSDIDFWYAIKQRLVKKKVNPDIIQILQDRVPASTPCVLTHGDLSSVNIIIQKGKVAAIMGFDNAASLPVWAETVAAHFCYCKEDVQWKAMLSRHMRSYQAALDWWSLWRAAEALEPNQERIAKLIRRCRRWTKTTVNRKPFAGPDSSEDEADGKPPEPGSGHVLSLSEHPPSGPSTGREGFEAYMSGALSASGAFPASAGSSQQYHEAIQDDLLQGNDYLAFLKTLAWESAREGDREGGEEEEEVDEQERDEMKRQLEREKKKRFARQHYDATPGPKDKPGESSRRQSFKTTSSISTEEDGRGVPSDASSLLAPPIATPREKGWRPKSFDGSKGLRPLSLPLYPSSSSLYDNRPTPDEGENSSREETIEETLRTLSRVDEEDDASSRGKGKGKEKAVEPTLQRKRTSVFKSTQGGAPGSLYAALQRKAAEKKGAGVRSWSEERREMPAKEEEGEGEGTGEDGEEGEEEEEEGDGHKGIGSRGRRKGRPRPLSLMFSSI